MDEANRTINQKMDRSRPYISAQEAIDYHNRSDQMKSAMTEADRKQTHYDIYNPKRKKDKDGEKK